MKTYLVFSLLAILAGTGYFLYRTSLSSFGGIFDRDIVATFVLTASVIFAIDLLLARLVSSHKGLLWALGFFLAFFTLFAGVAAFLLF